MDVDPTSWMFLTVTCVAVLLVNISKSEQESEQKSLTSFHQFDFFTFQSRVKNVQFCRVTMFTDASPRSASIPSFETAALFLSP